MELKLDVWLAAKVEELSRFPNELEFVKSYREGPKAIIVWKGGRPLLGGGGLCNGWP